jgi:hypothetical protein
MLRYVIGQKVPDVSKDHSAFIFRFKQFFLDYSSSRPLREPQISHFFHVNLTALLTQRRCVGTGDGDLKGLEVVALEAEGRSQ